MPNHPHFRLGPLDGSVCDTLGIDMLPPVGIAPDPDPRGALVVYPNPTNGPLRLSWPAKQGKGTLVLTNMLGITLNTQIIDLSTGFMDLDASGLSTGIYFYELKTLGVTTVPQKVSIIRD